MVLTLERVTFRYAGAARPSLVDVDLGLAGGEIVGIMGADEAGKTTLCLVAGGLAPRIVPGVMDGRLIVDGEDVGARPLHELIASVAVGFADPGAHLSGVCDSVFEEVAFGPSNLGVPLVELTERVAEALARLGIAELASRHPARLSGGQRQLVGLAGLLAMRPRYVVLDEPTAHLDPRGARLVMDSLATLAADGMGVLVAEHRAGELARLCHRVAILDAGRMVAQGTAATLLADPRLKDLGVAEPPALRVARLVAEAGLGRTALAGSPPGSPVDATHEREPLS